MRKLTVTMRPRQGGQPITKTRTMNDRYTESHQLQQLAREIQRTVAVRLKLSDYAIVTI